jgi:hypothetical protein
MREQYKRIRCNSKDLCLYVKYLLYNKQCKNRLIMILPHDFLFQKINFYVKTITENINFATQLIAL